MATNRIFEEPKEDGPIDWTLEENLEINLERILKDYREEVYDNSEWEELFDFSLAEVNFLAGIVATATRLLANLRQGEGKVIDIDSLLVDILNQARARLVKRGVIDGEEISEIE